MLAPPRGQEAVVQSVRVETGRRNSEPAAILRQLPWLEWLLLAFLPKRFRLVLTAAPFWWLCCSDAQHGAGSTFSLCCVGKKWGYSLDLFIPVCMKFHCEASALLIISYVKANLNRRF